MYIIKILNSQQSDSDKVIALTQALNQEIQLSLGCCKMRDPDVLLLAQALKANKTVIRISFLGNFIGPEGAIALAEALKTNQTLQSLCLSYNKVGSEGAIALADALKTNHTLNSLTLTSISIGPEGISALAKALKINQTLQSLCLDYNEIGSEGAIALADALKINQALNSLDLCSTLIDSKGFIALAKALKINKTLTSLIFDQNTKSISRYHLVLALEKNFTLTKLDLKCNKTFKAKKKAYLKRNLKRKSEAIYEAIPHLALELKNIIVSYVELSLIFSDPLPSLAQESSGITLYFLFDYIINNSTLKTFAAALNTYLTHRKHTVDDVVSPSRNTLLIIASFLDRLEIVKFLVIHKKANINAINIYGKTALMYALSCDSNSRNPLQNEMHLYGRTLMYCPYYQKEKPRLNLAIVKFLLEQEDINLEIIEESVFNDEESLFNGEDSLFNGLVVGEQDEAKRRIYQNLISKGANILQALTFAYEYPYMPISVEAANKKNAVEMIFLCLKEEGRFIPPLPPGWNSIRAKNYDENMRKHNAALMMHAAASGFTIKRYTNLANSPASVISQCLYQDPLLRDLFEEGYMGRPPIIMSGSLPFRVTKPKKPTSPQDTSSSVSNELFANHSKKSKK